LSLFCTRLKNYDRYISSIKINHIRRKIWQRVLTQVVKAKDFQELNAIPVVLSGVKTGIVLELWEKDKGAE
tara:strand:+ start:118 stop:330 length:213 start_codon:yes stop_codon:yes gene_type:complete